MTISDKAIVDGSGLVLNTVMAGPDFVAPPGCILVDVAHGAEPGGTWAGGVFTPPASPAPVIPGTAILDALSPEQAAKADVRDLVRIGAAADVNTVKSKVRRVAAAAGTTAAALSGAASAGALRMPSTPPRPSTASAAPARAIPIRSVPRAANAALVKRLVAQGVQHAG